MLAIRAPVRAITMRRSSRSRWRVTRWSARGGDPSDGSCVSRRAGELNGVGTRSAREDPGAGGARANDAPCAPGAWRRLTVQRCPASKRMVTLSRTVRRGSALAPGYAGAQICPLPPQAMQTCASFAHASSPLRLPAHGPAREPCRGVWAPVKLPVRAILQSSRRVATTSWRQRHAALGRARRPSAARCSKRREASFA